MYLMCIFVFLVLQDCGMTGNTVLQPSLDDLDELQLRSQDELAEPDETQKHLQNDINNHNNRFYNSETADETRASDIHEQLKRLILDYIERRAEPTESPKKLVTYISNKTNHSNVTNTQTPNRNHSVVTPTPNANHSPVSTTRPPTQAPHASPESTHKAAQHQNGKASTKATVSPHVSHPVVVSTKMPTSNSTNGQVSVALTNVEQETEFFDCPVLEPLLFQYFKDFPSAKDTVEKTNFSAGDFDKVIGSAIKLFIFTKEPKLVSNKFSTDVARQILDQRFRCPATKFQTIIVHLVKRELHNILNVNDKKFQVNTLKILSDSFPNIQAELVENIAKTLTLVMHKGVFEELISLLEVEEFVDLYGFLHQLVVISRASFRNFTTGIKEPQMFNVLKQKFEKEFRNHPDAYMCTSPQKLVSAQQTVIKDRVKQFSFIERAGMLMAYSRNLIRELFSEFHINLMDQIMIRLSHNAVEYMKVAAYKIQNYFQKIANDDVNMVTEALKNELDKDKFAVVEILMKMMGMYPNQTQPDVDQMKQTMKNYLQHDIQQLTELVRIVRKHKDISDDVKTDILLIVQELLMKKKIAMKHLNDKK